LDDAFAEDAVGPDHQREDHQDVGREVLGAAADQRVDVAGRDVLDDADDEAADDRAGDGIEATRDDPRDPLEAGQPQGHGDAEQVAPQDAAERRHHAGHGPRDAEVALDVDAHGHG